MNVVNHTPFPAQAFQAVDQHEQQFDVFVLRQTLSFENGKLTYADEQTPLCTSDEYFSENTTGGVRQESDLCPYKPKCDVIVNAVAHAPQGKASSAFLVRLRMAKVDISTGPYSIDKVLRVTGERHFKKRAWLIRMLQFFIKLGSLTLLRPTPWKLTQPKQFTALPLRAEFAFGGECIIKGDDRAARRVPKKHRLTDEQQAIHPEAHLAISQPPIAHALYEPNPAGTGYAPGWYLKATRQRAVQAPRIERPSFSWTAKQYWLSQLRAQQKIPTSEPEGFNVRPKSHPARRILLGAVTADLAASTAVLPIEFDFNIWNAAPPDQQIDFLIGDEKLELINMCPSDVPHTAADAYGNSIVRLALPGNECFILLKHDNETTSTRALAIDTVLIEPETYRLTLVWRLVIPHGEVNPLRGAEFRMRTFYERDKSRLNTRHQQGTGALVTDEETQAAQI